MAWGGVRRRLTLTTRNTCNVQDEGLARGLGGVSWVAGRIGGSLEEGGEGVCLYRGRHVWLVLCWVSLWECFLVDCADGGVCWRGSFDK